jgi:ABC-type multidrug transport system ATPase subunit
MTTHILKVAERLIDATGNMVGSRLTMQRTLEELHEHAGNSRTSLQDALFALIASRTVGA